MLKPILSAFAITCFLSASLPALAVPESDQQIVYNLLANLGSFATTHSFTGVDNKKISYTRFGQQAGPKGCVLISQGQGESALKYLELAHDLVQEGYAPVYAIDHRGQGFSDRLLPDRQKSYVDDFNNFAIDLQTLVNDHFLRDPDCQRKDTFLIAHSMGGAIAATYLEKAGASAPFKKVVLSSPMLKLQLPEGKSENGVLWETWAACNTPFGPKCLDYIPGKNSGPYNPDHPFEGNILTHSKARFEFNRYLRNNYPELQLGSPTIFWVRESVKADVALRKRSNIARTKIPTLLLQAGNDGLVDNFGEVEYCSLHVDCRLKSFAAANHELLMESDSIRNDVMSAIFDFLRN